MGSNASLLDLIAHGGSLRATQDNQQQAAQTQGTQANTALTNTQIPVQQELAKQEAVKTQIAQRQLDGQKALQDYYARLHSQNQDAIPPASATPQSAVPPAPPAATPDVQGNPTPVGAVAPGAIPPPIGAAVPPRVLGPSASVRDPNAFFNDLMSNKVPPEIAMQHVNSLLKYNQELAGLDTTQLDNKAKRLSMAGDAVSGYIQNPTPEGYAQAKAEVTKTDPEHASLLPDPATTPLPSEAQLATFLGATGEVKKLVDLRTQKQATSTSAAQQSEAEATTKKTNAEAGIQQIKLDGMKGATPQQLSASIDQIIDPAKYPAQNQRAKGMANFALQRGDDPSVAVRSVAEEVGAIDKEMNPALRNARIDDEVTKTTRTAPIEVGKAVAERKAILPLETQAAVDKETALAKLSPDAFGGIYNPTARNQAMNEYDKIAKERDDKANSSQTLIDTIDAATKGNKVAAGVIPIETVRQFVGRVNKQELSAVSTGAGSALDRVQTWFDKNATGEPPSWLLSDVRSIADLQKKAADRGFASGLQRLKARGVDTSKLAANPSASSQMVRARDPQGTLHEAPAGTPLPAGWKAE